MIDKIKSHMRKHRWLGILAGAVLVAFVGVQATFAFLATGTEPITNVFKPMAYKQGQILVSKVLHHPFGASYVIPDDIKFDFTLKFEAKTPTDSAYQFASTGSVYRYAGTGSSYLFRTSGSSYQMREATPSAYAFYVFDVLDDNGNKINTLKADKDGIVQVSLKPNESIQLGGIDEGTTVTVTEEQNWPQFYVVGDNIQQMVIDDSDPNYTGYMQFVNKYEVLHGTATDYEVYIDKTFTGRDMQAGDSFKFLMEYSINGGQWQEFASAYVADRLNADGPDGAFGIANNGLTDMRFTEPGVYAFRISEVIPAENEKLANVTYDTTKSTFTVSVGDDDMDGTLDVLKILPGTDSQDTVKVDRDQKQVIVSFTNTYKKPAGGGGGGGVVKPNDKVPEVLNGGDHFAYVFGYPDGTVQPNGYITRAEVAAIFYRLLDADVRAQYVCDTNTFIDVPADAWYITDISTMAAMGIVNGYPDGSAHPDAPITRAEFTAMASRFDNFSTPADVVFSDIDGHWAKDSILAAVEARWIVGYDDGTFRPDNNITRAEAMAIVNRVLCRQPETVDDLHPDMIHWPDNADSAAWYYLTVQEATNGHQYEWKDNHYEHWTELDNAEEKQSFLNRIRNLFRSNG